MHFFLEKNTGKYISPWVEQWRGQYTVPIVTISVRAVGITSPNFKSEHSFLRVQAFEENHEKEHSEQVPCLFYVTAIKDNISSINMM